MEGYQNNQIIKHFFNLSKEEQSKIKSNALVHLNTMIENKKSLLTSVKTKTPEEQFNSLKNKYEMDYMHITYLKYQIKKICPEYVFPKIIISSSPDTYLDKLNKIFCSIVGGGDTDDDDDDDNNRNQDPNINQDEIEEENEIKY